ncbi:M16 family metallopeptidase [Rubrivirga sp.]|uniref:M16 family metallopeptidase n=1 Tax=Rubrivirga sp. TaxID=1885344 RepID=UPI003C794663
MPDVSLASRVLALEAGPADLLVLPTDVRDVVSFRGSFESAPDLGVADDVVQSLVAGLLDKGTKHRDRFEVSEALEGRGAQLSFYSDGLRMGFAGRALRDDLPDVIALLAEQLLEPALEDAEIEKAIVRATASVRRSRESTGSQASGAFARRLYGEAHPNYVLEPDDELDRLKALTPDEIRSYHETHVGSDGLTVAVVGDVDIEATQSAFASALGEWARHGRSPQFEPSPAPQPPGRVVVEMADRRNLDVRIGHAVDLRRDSDDFLAAYAGVFALGGNFSGRLMQTVRDEQGLTYGIGSDLGAPSVRHDGHVRVRVALSQENLERGIEATRAEVAAFVLEGVSPEVLEQTQTTLAGRHVVGLATTGGVAARLLINAERGFEVGYLDAYPDLVSALTADDVTGAVQRHIRPDEFQVAVAGTLPE